MFLHSFLDQTKKVSVCLRRAFSESQSAFEELSTKVSLAENLQISTLVKG